MEDNYYVLGLRKKEIQLKQKMKLMKYNSDEKDNLFSSSYFKILSEINDFEKISEIENLDSFIKNYENYIFELEETQKVNKI